MILCNSCGAENPDGSIYCEDCGAQLELSSDADRPRSGPLAAGAEVAGRFRVESLLEGGSVLRYRARRDGEAPCLLLEARRAGSESPLTRQKALLDGLSSEGLVQPAEFLTEGDFDYAIAAWPGQRLEDLVNASGPWSADRTQTVLLTLLTRLEALHAAGLISRAVQPGRIWIDEDGEALLDLWERTAPLDESSADSDEMCSVTPGFSAPEMYGLGKQDGRLDLFSLCAVGYFMLTAKKLDLDSRESFFVIPPPQVEGSEGLVRVLMHGLRKKPEDRFPDAAAMRAALLNPESLPAPAEPAPTSAATPAPAPRPAPVPTPVPQAGSRGGTATATAPVAAASSREPAAGRVRTGPEVALFSHIGCVRSINQDACLDIRFRFYEKSVAREGWLVTVIDGMGGEAEGDKAASLALRTIAAELVAGELPLRDGRGTTPLMPESPVERGRFLLERALRKANRTIFDYAGLDASRRGMGCTITACLLLGNKAIFAQVGDTRGYHGRRSLTQVTTDHSLVGRLVAMGSLTPEEARTSPQRSIIYRALGTNPDVEVDLFERDLEPGDRLLLCSDGVWEYFEASEFEGLAMADRPPAEVCRQLVDVCLSRGADDNATVAIVQF